MQMNGKLRYRPLVGPAKWNSAHWSIRQQCTAGSYALQDAVLPADSTVVVKLRQKGLVILGKTSLTEWSMFRANNWGHAWNPICGQTYGAYYPRQCPGGSSSGSAVAADLGLAWATIGTEVDISPESLTIAIVLSRVVGQTAGSIVNPSEKNNIVGIKPTVGLTSRYLVVPVSAHQDTIGPMARTVKDAASLLQAIMGTDANDFATLVSPFHERIPDYVASCKVNGLEGKRIGIARNVIEQSQPDALYTIEEFEHAIFVMKQAGATVVENTNFMAFSEWKERKYNPVTRADFVSNIAEFFKKLERNPNNIDSIESLREFTRNYPAEDYPARNTANWDVAIDNQLSSTCPEFKSLYQENLFLGGEGGILGALERHCLDAIALPTTVAFEIPALVGTPIITVPLGAASADTPVTKETPDDVVEMAPGIPFGISFLGAKWSEETLIEIAYAFEQRTAVRQCLKRSIEP